jgi:hypothetical protein
MPAKKPSIYHFEVQLINATIPVWRIIEVDRKTTLQELGAIILVAMGWQSSHLFEFSIFGKVYTCFDYDDGFDDLRGDTPVELAHSVKLDQLELRVGDFFTFTYDLGDNWEHLITLKGVGEKSNALWGYPICSAGSMNCPPEDLGGVAVYNALVEFILHKKPIPMNPDIGNLYKKFNPYHIPNLRSVSFAHYVKGMLKRYDKQ